MEMNRTTIKRVYIFFDTLFGIVLMLILMPQLLYYAFVFSVGEMYEGIYAMLPCYVCLFTVLFFSFSLIRIVVTTECTPLRESFWGKGIDASLKSRFLFLIRQKEFWFKACIIALIYLLLPLNLTFKALAVALQCGSSFADKLKALAIFLPILLAVAVLAHLRAYKDWSKNKDPKKYSDAAFAKDVVKVCVIYALGSTAFVMGFPFVIVVVLLVLQLLTIGRVIGIAILLTIPTIYRLIRAYCKRRTCIRQLRNVCAQKGYVLSEIAHPYSALFRFPEGESFQVTVNEKSYSCKFITARKRTLPLSIYENGVMAFHHIVRIRNVEVFQYSVTHEFGYESGNPKILIVNPTPKNIYTLRAGNVVEIDNGEVIGDYKVFTATAFLRALELNTLDR